MLNALIVDPACRVSIEPPPLADTCRQEPCHICSSYYDRQHSKHTDRRKWPTWRLAHAQAPAGRYLSPEAVSSLQRPVTRLPCDFKDFLLIASMHLSVFQGLTNQTGAKRECLSIWRLRPSENFPQHMYIGWMCTTSDYTTNWLVYTTRWPALFIRHRERERELRETALVVVRYKRRQQATRLGWSRRGVVTGNGNTYLLHRRRLTLEGITY